MRTLRVYGDSFADSRAAAAGWVKILSEKLDIALKNNAMSSSSTEYSFKLFMDDVQNNVIGDTDIIIFVTSSLGRLYFSYQQHKNPESAALFLRPPSPNIKQDWSWYHENKNHIEWWMLNNDRDTQSNSFEAYLQVLKVFAISRPACTVIVLPAFEYNYSEDPFQETCPRNFLRPSVILMNISKAEIGFKHHETMDYPWFTQFIKFDPRVNHLTNPNLNILAELLAESIETLSVTNITYDKFQSNNITQIEYKDQYMNYLKSNIISHRLDLLSNLK
jgi:hypothetical protein